MQRRVELRELDERAQDHPRMRPALAPRAAPAMAHGDLLDPEARGAGADQDLGVHEGTDRLDRDRLERRAMEDLERAVDVAHRQIEEPAHERAPARGDHPPQPRIPARCAVAGDDLERVGVVEELPDLRELELEIGVAEEDELAAGGLEPRAQRRPVALVLRVMHRAHAPVAPAPVVEHRPARVLRAVVDDHDLEVDAELYPDRERAREQRRQVLGLVPGREHERERGLRRSRSGHASLGHSRLRPASLLHYSR